MRYEVRFPISGGYMLPVLGAFGFISAATWDWETSEIAPPFFSGREWVMGFSTKAQSALAQVAIMRVTAFERERGLNGRSSV